MAGSVDPLQRARIGVVSQDTGDRYAVPQTNRTLQLAQALGETLPAVREAGQALAGRLQESASAQARRDAIANGGTELAAATRAGTIHATQNPWYVSAYRRESAALRTQATLRHVMADSASWPEQNDPEAFARRWHQAVHDAAGAAGEDPDSAAGFAAAEAPITSQALQSNISQRAHDIEQERVQNVSALAAQSLADAVRRSGGSLSPNAAFQALTPARERWFATGGSVDGWNQIMTQAIVSAADSTANANLVDLARAPELINGPTEDGADPMPFRDVAPNHPALSPSPAAPPPAPAAPQEGEAPAFQPGAHLTLDEGQHPPAPAGTVAGRSYLPIMTAVGHRFGERRSRGDGTYRMHGGMDLQAPPGSQVKAPPRVTGRVSFAGHRGNYGNLVEVEYGGGIVARYGHLSGIAVHEGQEVTPAMVVGFSGGRRGAPGSGNSTGPHLHYEVRRGGVAVDPRTVTFASISSPQAAQQEATQGANAPPPSNAPALAPLTSGADEAPAVADIVSRGPSLYDIAGAAGAFEQARYRIGASIRSQAQDRLQAEIAGRRLRGIEAADQLWARYGTRLLTGDFDRNTLVREMTAAGYAPQVQAEALNLIRSATGDSAGIAEAQISARGSDPNQAQEILDLAAEGRRNGDSPEYQHRVGEMVLRGRITAQTGIAMVEGAISRSQSLQAQDRAEAAEDRRRQREHNPINSYADLDSRAEGLADHVIAQAQRLGIRIPQGFDAAHTPRTMTTNTIRRAMNDWLATHPNDWAGAEQAGRNSAARIIRNNMAARARAQGHRASNPLNVQAQ